MFGFIFNAASIDTNETGEVLLRLVGHGHHSGQNGDLYSELNNISTAKQIIDFAVVKQH
jgi:hypothetical protein